MGEKEIDPHSRSFETRLLAHANVTENTPFHHQWLYPQILDYVEGAGYRSFSENKSSFEIYILKT